MKNKFEDIFDLCNLKQNTEAVNFPLIVSNLAKMLKQHIIYQEETNELIMKNFKECITKETDILKQIIQKKLIGIDRLDQKIEKLNDISKQEIFLSIKQVKSQLRKLEYQIKETIVDKNEIKKTVEQVRQSLDFSQQGIKAQIQQKIYRELDIMDKNIDDDIDYLHEKISQLYKMSGYVQKKQNNKIMREITRDNRKINRSKISQNWVDSKCYYFKQLKFSDRDITNKSNEGSVYIFGKRNVQNGDKFSFGVTFCKIKEMAALGVIDLQHKNHPFPQSMPHRVQYWSDGQLSVGGNQISKGKNFKTGQQLIVDINTKQGTIVWRTGGNIKHQKCIQMLKSKNIKWVPYIRLRNQNDTVRIDK